MNKLKYIRIQNEDGSYGEKIPFYIDGSTVEINGQSLTIKINEINSSLANKVIKEQGKGLSSNDYTNEEKQKLSNIDAGATNTIIDSTLNIEGAAADALAVKEKINIEKNVLQQAINLQANHFDAEIAQLQSLVGSPLTALTVSEMTDTDKIYVYTGSESGYINGNWYYWDGSAWISGGVYNAVAINIDSTPVQGSNNVVRSGGMYSALVDKVAKPITSPDGTAGQVLRTNGDGTTTWVYEGQPTDEQTVQAVNSWLNDHPEATTTVQDEAITEVKFADSLKLKTIKDYVTPEMFGAVGNGTKDDSIAIQNALNSGKPVVFSQKTYHIENTIEISNHGSSSAVWTMDARNAKFHYTGNDYAFFIHSLINSKLYFGSIISTNGGNIKFISGDTSAHRRSQYITIEFGIMQAAAGFSNVYAENFGTEWINEIKWIGGRFAGNADCNFNIVRNAPNDEINGWSFYRIGFEGSTTCIQLGGTYAINNFGIYDCRYTESYTNFIVANGPTNNIVVYSPRPVPMEKVHWNSNCDRWRFYTGNYESLSIKKGVAHYINTSRSISGGIEIEANTDIDDVTLVGNYVIGTSAIAATLANLPLASAGKLIVESLTSNGKSNPDEATSRYLLQTFIPSQVGVKFTRRINITNSGESKEVFEWVSNYPYYPNLSFSSGDDLNNYLSVGTWFSGNSTLTQSLLNRPSGISNMFRLDVIAINSTKGTGFVSGMVRQQKIQDGKGHIFIRMLSTSNNALSIGDWLQVTTSTVS